MPDTLRENIEEAYKRKQRAKNRDKLKQQIKNELRDEMKDQTRHDTVMGRFIMPRSLMLTIAVTLFIYAIVFAFAALDAGRHDLLPTAVLLPLVGFPVAFVLIYVQFFLTWITYRFFWLFSLIIWLIVATGGLIYAVRWL